MELLLPATNPPSDTVVEAKTVQLPQLFEKSDSGYLELSNRGPGQE